MMSFFNQRAATGNLTSVHMCLLARWCLRSHSQGTHEVLCSPRVCEFWARRPASLGVPQLSRWWTNSPSWSTQHRGNQRVGPWGCKYSVQPSGSSQASTFLEAGVAGMGGLFLDRSSTRLIFSLRCSWLIFNRVTASTSVWAAPSDHGHGSDTGFDCWVQGGKVLGT